MEITQAQKNGINIVKLQGRLDTTNYRDAEAEFKNLIDGGAKNIVVNIEKLDYISSAGLRSLLAALKSISAKGGKLVVSNPQPSIQEVFKVSGFSKFLKVYKTESEAFKELK